MNRNPMDETDEITEEADYVNAPVPAVDKDQRRLFFTRSLPLIAVCWLILLLIMGLRIHYTSVISEHDPKLTAENQNLREQNQNLREQNQQLKTEKTNLSEQIQTMETNWNELNVSRAQWSIDAYCPKTNNGRQCNACQQGWVFNQANCYMVQSFPPSGQRTWEQALEDCRGKNADLAVVQNQQEKDIINGYSWVPFGYWIGLRVEEGKWKWIDGTELTEASWIGPATEGHCAVSIQNRGWKSKMCNDTQRWICIQKALTV